MPKSGKVDTVKDQMSFFEEGGLLDDGQNIEPVTGNEIPPGSMAKEVRDDVPAQLSEGEYVVPADVVRYFGVKFFEELRSEAKGGLNHMEQTGRIGGEPVNDQGIPMESGGELTQEELAVLSELGMATGGFIEPPQAMGNTGYPTEKGFANGGDATQPAFDPSKYPLGFSTFGTAAGTPTDTTQDEVIKTVVLYGPDGLTRTLTLPAEQDTYDRLISEGYSEDSIGVSTEVTKPWEHEGGGPDGGYGGDSSGDTSSDSQAGPPSYGIGTEASIGLGGLAGGVLGGGIAGAIGGGLAGKQAADFNDARNGLVDALMSNDMDAVKDAEAAVEEAFGAMGKAARASVFGEGKTARDAITNVHNDVNSYRDSLSSMTSASSASSVSGATGGEGPGLSGPGVPGGTSAETGLGGADVSFGGGVSDTGSGVGIAGSGTAGGGFAEAGLGGAGVSFGGDSSGSSSGGSSGGAAGEATGGQGDQGQGSGWGGMAKGGIVKKKTKKRPPNKRKKPVKRKGLGGRK